RDLPAIEELVDRLNQAEPSLSWAPIQETLKRACWQRCISSDTSEVRFFTDEFVFTNNSPTQRNYRFRKSEADNKATASALVDLHSHLIQRVNGDLHLEVSLAPGQTISITVHPSLQPTTAYQPGRSYSLKVFTRRVLSEFRDEVLVKHPGLLAPAKKVVRLM